MVKNFIKNLFITVESLLFKSKKRKDVLFVVSNELMFSYARPIYEQLKKDSRIRIRFCFYTPQRFKKGNLPQIKQQYGLHDVFWKLGKFYPWDLILFPYHGPYFRKSCRKIYIGHGLNSGKLIGGEYKKYGSESRDASRRIIYDKIFCCHESEKEMAKTQFPDHYPKVKVMGNLLVDELLNLSSGRNNILQELDLDPSRKTILVASTWGPYSFAQNLGVRFMENIERILQKYNVILSLHQNNFVPTDSPDINWAKIVDQTRYKNLFILRKNEPTFRFLPAADVLVCDHSSISLYYLFLARPIIFYDNPNVHYEAGAHILEMRKAAYVLSDIGELDGDIQKACDQFDPQKAKNATVKVCSFVGRAWDRYEEEIYDVLFLQRPSGSG